MRQMDPYLKKLTRSAAMQVGPSVPVPQRGNGHALEAEVRAAGAHAETEALQIRAATSVILERLQFLRQAGITFHGLRDMYEVLGYDRLISTRQYRDRYARGGIAGRIVDSMPHATWRGTVTLSENDDPKTTTTFEKAWADLEQQHQVTAKLMRVDTLSRLSTYAVLLIGAPGSLNTELPKGTPGKVLYLTPFLGGGGPGGDTRSRAAAMDADCTIETFDVSTQSPRFGQPLTYRLKRTDIVSPELQVPVHFSRLIHIAEGCLSDEVYGQPALERVWNLLDDLDKVTGGGAEAFWLRANQGLHLNIDKDMALPDAKDQVKALREQTEEYQHGLTRWLRTRGVDVNTLGSDVANFSNPADAILTQIAGAKGMPKRILTGSEMGELASSQDRDNWKDQIDGRQKQYAGPYIVRRLADRLIQYGYLPSPSKSSIAYEVVWPHIQTLTEDEKANGAQKWAQVNATAGQTVFTAEEIRDKWYGMEPGEPSDQEAWRANLALRMASVNKTQGVTVFTSAEIRKTCFGWSPLSPEEEKPVNAPEKISATPQQEENALLTAEEKQEMLRVLEAAVREKNLFVIDKILGVEPIDDPSASQEELEAMRRAS